MDRKEALDNKNLPVLSSELTILRRLSKPELNYLLAVFLGNGVDFKFIY